MLNLIVVIEKFHHNLFYKNMIFDVFYNFKTVNHLKIFLLLSNCLLILILLFMSASFSIIFAIGLYAKNQMDI